MRLSVRLFSLLKAECRQQRIPTGVVDAFTEPVCPNQNRDLEYNGIARQMHLHKMEIDCSYICKSLYDLADSCQFCIEFHEDIMTS